MSIAQAMLGEFEHEATITRRFLERVPQDKLTWRPHEKSHTVGALARHIAIVPGNVVRFAQVDQAAVPSQAELFHQPASVEEILAALETSVATVRAVLPTLDDAHLMTSFSATIDGKVVATMPKVMALRLIMLNHWIQHRGQLGVHLRLLGAKVPASYGPSGDEA